MKIFLFILLILPITGIAQFDQIDTNNFDYKLLDKLILEEVNKLRKRKRADSLVHDPSLDLASEDHATYMGENGILTHQQKKTYKRTPYDRVTYYNGTHEKIGENVQVVPIDYMLDKSNYRLTYQKLAKEIVDTWEKSKGHYANMIDPSFVGVSHAFYEKDGQLYICQVFGSKPFEEKHDFEKGEAIFVKNKDECIGCKIVTKKINKDEAFLGWYTVSNDSIYYWNVDYYGKKRNLKKIFRGHGTIAIDLIHQEQFNCNGNASYHNSLYHDGYYLGYIDKYVIQTQDLQPHPNIVQVYVGMKPAFRDTFFQVDFNYIRRKRPCMHSMTIYVNPDYLRPAEYFSIPKPEIGLNKEIIVRDSVEVRIGFERNQTNEDTTIFRPLIKSLDSLVLDKHEIVSIYFTGVASIEGSEKENEKLFRRRGAIIENYLKTYYPELKLQSEFFENFDDFRAGLAALGYQDLIGFPNDSLRIFANEHKNEPEIEQLLDETRYSSVRIIFRDVIPVKLGSYGMSVQRLQDLTVEKDLHELIPLYQVMTNRAIEGDTSIRDSLLTLNFPEEKLFARLHWYQFVLELHLTEKEVDYKRLNELKELDAIPNNADFLEYRLLFNVFYRKELIDISDYADIHSEIKQKRQKAWIESLELISGVLNYRYAHETVVPILINNVLKKKFDLKQTYFICQYLIEWGYTAEPYLLLSKFARRPGEFPKLYKQYLKLGYFLGQFDNKKEWKKIRLVLRNLANDHPNEFCDLFKWNQMGVRALEKEEIADLFCQKCRENP